MLINLNTIKNDRRKTPLLATSLSRPKKPFDSLNLKGDIAGA